MATLNEKEIFDMMEKANFALLESSKDSIEKETDLEKLRDHALRLHIYANNFIRSVFNSIKDTEEVNEKKLKKEENKQ